MQTKKLIHRSFTSQFALRAIINFNNFIPGYKITLQTITQFQNSQLLNLFGEDNWVKPCQ